MPTAAERQAVLFLAIVAALGAGVRLWQARAFEQALAEAAVPASLEALASQRDAVDEARASRPAKRRKSAPEAAVPVNPDEATAKELETLPRIGPALAARIVANRDSFGPFGSLEALQRVRGIGPAMAAQLAPRVTFSPGIRPSHGVSP
jgi:DNA uptake protein ComE-like DNA-binding protein